MNESNKPVELSRKRKGYQSSKIASLSRHLDNGEEYKSSKFRNNLLPSINEFTSNKSCHSNTNSSKVKNILLSEADLTFLETLYKNDNKFPNLVKNLLKVKDCSILKYGITPSYENISFSYCKTCDKDLIKPICESCIIHCHKGHRISVNFEKGKIKCCCGAKMHLTKANNDKNIDYCIFNEWVSVSKLNFMYKTRTKNQKYLCIFCHYICNKNDIRDKKIKFENNKNIKCNCSNNDMHNDSKEILSLIDELFSNPNNDIKNLLNPTQIVNMIFKSSDSLNIIFPDFYNYFIFNKSKINIYFRNDNFNKTNLYLSLILFRNLFKASVLSYYCAEIENYFSFDNFKNVINEITKNNFNEKSYLCFCKEFIFLLGKIYIANKTKHLFRVNKINDLENLSCIQRLLLFENKEKDDYNEIICFFLKILKNVEINNIFSIEAMDYFKSIIGIYKKLTSFNLINFNEMIQILKNIELIIKKMNLARNAKISSNSKINIEEVYNSELKLLNQILKMIIFFIYHNNDKIIYNILFDDENYPLLKNVTQNKTSFSLNKSIIGNSINRIAIRILYIQQKYYYEKDRTKIYQETLNNAIKIINFSLISNDNYMLNIIQSLKYLHQYPSILYITKTEIYTNYYNSFNNVNALLDNVYYEYLNFIVDKEKLIDSIIKSLDIIFEDQMNFSKLEKNIDEINIEFPIEKTVAIIHSHFFYKISKIFSVLFQPKYIKNDYNNIKINIFIKKILCFYFIFINQSSDNSILLLSSCILEKIIKIPNKSSLLLFKLIHKCFNNIYLYDGLIINFTYIIKDIYKYLDQLIFLNDDFDYNNNKNNIEECVLYFMQILKIIIYNLKLTYKCDEFISEIKNIISNLNLKYKLSIKYFRYKIDEPKTEINNLLTRNSEVTDTKKNYIYKIFLIYIRLINDIFDFSLDNERSIINTAINVDMLIFGLSNFVLTLDERTEFIRFIRKMILDINYCEQKEHLYTSFIINNKDNLNFIKNNPLIHDLKFPTQLISFKKDFYSISEMTVIKEKNNRHQNKEKTFALLSKNIINSILSNSFDISNLNKSNINYNASSEIFSKKSQNLFLFNKNKSQISLDVKYPKLSSINNFTPNSKIMRNLNQHIKRNSMILNTKSFIKNEINEISEYNSNYKNNSIKKSNNNDTFNRNNSSPFNSIADQDRSISSPNNRNVKYSTFLKKEGFTSPYFDDEFYSLIYNELEFVNYYVSNLKISTKENNEELRNYFENGLLIPIIFYFKRVFIYINLYTGYEMIKIYELLVKSINLKIKISKYDYDFWGRYQDDSDETEKEFNSINNNLNYENIRNIYKNKSCIDGSCFLDPKLIKETFLSLNSIIKKKCSFFDYSILNQIVDKEFFSLIKNGKKYSVFNLFKENKYEYNFKFEDDYFGIIQDMISKEEKNINNYDKKNLLEKKLIRIYLIYKYNKFFFSKENNNLSLFDIFNEICLEFQNNYLYLLIYSLISHTHENNNNELFNIGYYILFILLMHLPSEVQFQIKNLLGGESNENFSFMKKLSQILCQKLILSFIDYFNPQDKIICSHYLIAYNLIKIFKSLCKEYNTFFQHHLLKSLKYVYNKYVPEKYEVKYIKNNVSTILSDSFSDNDDFQVSSSHSSQDMPITAISNSTIINYKNDEIKLEINFQDFCICVLIKILLILDMFDKKYDSSNDVNPCLYFLFQCILEMLNLLIQGNKLQSFNYLNNQKINSKMFKNFFSNYKNSQSTSGNKEGDKSLSSSDSSISTSELNTSIIIQIGEPFIILIEQIIEILFHKTNKNLNFELEFNLTLFILSVLEENNIRSEIKSTLIKKLNIQTIINKIGELLKVYYLYHQEKNRLEKLQKIKRISEEKLNKKQNTNNQTEIYRNEIILKALKCNTNTEKSKLNNETFNTSSQLPLESQIPSLIHKKTHSQTNKKKTENDSKKILNEINNISSTKPIFKNDTIFFKNKIIKLIFDEKLCEFFQTQFFKINNDFLQCKEFKLANLLYKCLKITAVQHKKPEAEELIKKTKFIFKKFKTENKNNDLEINEYINLNLYSEDFNNQNVVIRKTSSDILRKKKRGNRMSSVILPKLPDKSKPKTKNLNPILNYSNAIKLDNINNNIKVNIKTNNDKSEIEQFYIVKFFEKITSTVEIRTKEGEKYTAIFTKLPEMKYLSQDSKVYFLEKVNRESELNKKIGLLKNLDWFIYEINYYQYNKYPIVKWFSKQKFFYYQLFSFVFGISINFFELFTFKGDFEISNINTTIKRREENFKKVSSKVYLSKWRKYYYCINFFNIIINIYFIVIWMYFRFPLYYKLDEMKYIDNYKVKQKLKLKEKIYIIIFITISKRNYIYSLIFQLIFSLLNLISHQQVFNVLLLLPIISLSKTLKSLFKSIRLKLKELGIVCSLAFILIYVFSNFGYFFFKNDYEYDVFSLEDNFCNSLVSCFLNALDNGLRARGGIGDSGKRISYLRDKKHYIGRIFLDVLYFLFIIICIIDMIFGIIIQTFRVLRNKIYKESIDSKENCFICHINRKTLAKYSPISFEKHNRNLHNVWKYVEYMISLIKINTNKLNYLDTYVKMQIINKKVEWLPTYKDLIIEQNKIKNFCVEKKEPEVLEEPIAQYKILTLNRE